VNPYTSLAGFLLWGASIGATGWWFYGAGQDHCKAVEARDEEVARIATEAATSAAASAIAKIEVKNTTIRQTLEKEVHEKTVFRDCRSGPDAVRMLNSSPAIAASGPEPVGGGQLPASGAAR